MNDIKWTDAEKKVARRAFDAAIERECAAIIVELKRSAATVQKAADLWSIHDYLSDKRAAMDRKYDYRYSQLIIVFGRLLRERWIEEADLKGLAEDKLDEIRRIASF